MSRTTILVVDNEPVSRNLMVHVLTGRGFRVYEADSTAEAAILCEALGSKGLDLVIAGEAAAGTTGRAVAEQVIGVCPNVKVLHISQSSLQEMTSSDLLVPGSSYLMKPFTAVQLLDAVRTTLEPLTQ